MGVELMLNELCKITKNYFSSNKDKHFGKYAIESGTVSLPFLKAGQYFRIVGSTFNDGIYQYPTSTLKDEEFTGSVWAMNVPPQFIALSEKIKTYNEEDGNDHSAFTSESFGGYSYSKATGKNGQPLTWQDVFEPEINQWRKIR